MGLTSCCGCFSLKTGTRIIGSLNIISSILWFISICIAIATFDTELLKAPNSTFDEVKIPLIRGAFAGTLTFSIIVFMLSAMLIIGTNNRNEAFIFPYLCCNVAGIVFSIPIFVALICFVSLAVPIGMGTYFCLVFASSLAINIYLCMVVYHFYRELLCEKFGRKINPSTGKIFKEPFENELKLTTFCGFYPLRSGVIFIGTLHLIGSILSLIALIIVGCEIEESKDPVFRVGLYYITKAILVGVMTYLIILVISIALLVLGVKERNVNYVFQYVCMNFMIVISSIVYGIGHLALALIVPEFTPLWITYIILFNGLILGLEIYAYLVIYSFYQELIQEKCAIGLSNTEVKSEIYREQLGYHMTVSSCCGCCSVRTGVLIIGTLHMISAGILLIIVCTKSSGYSYIIPLVLQFALAILLLVGVNQRNEGYVFPILCVYFTNIIGIIPISFTAHIQLGIWMTAPVWFYLVVILVTIIVLGLCIYFFMVVYSFYKELLNEKYSGSSASFAA
ncbi:hypothetical protein PV326_008729 [Microctonus aethiopoides]|nr:hypothetical protein PV326_008729 [Microctonus aethiopoides]